MIHNDEVFEANTFNPSPEAEAAYFARLSFISEVRRVLRSQAESGKIRTPNPLDKSAFEAPALI